MNEMENQDIEDMSMSEDAPKDQRISKFALIGAIILPFGLFLGLFLIPISARTTPAPPSTWQLILRYTVLPLSILSPIVATILGILGIAEIRRSKGKKYGMPLAVFVGMFYPVIFITLFLFTLGWLLLGNIDGWDIIPVVWFFLVLVIDYLIIRAVWNMATKRNQVTS
jgi:hypothetical protein